MDDLRVAWVQYNVQWHDWEANVSIIERYLSGHDQSFDLLLLPETFSTGYSMNPDPVAQAMGGPIVQWMTRTAAAKSATIMGSVIIIEDGKYYNRLICAYPDGTLNHYDKRHLFTYAGEHNSYTAGNHRLEVDVNGWKVCPLVCYDLRFPVWSRNVTDYDLLIYVANWPSPRVSAWEALLKARAIENLCYSIGVNRIGSDNNDFTYTGQSQAFDMSGHLIAGSGESSGIFQVALDATSMKSYRDRYNFLADRDSYIIE